MGWVDLFKVVGITASVIVFFSAFAVMFYYLINYLKLVHRAKKGDVAAQQLLAKYEAERAAALPSKDDDEDDWFCIHNPCTARGRREALFNDD